MDAAVIIYKYDHRATEWHPGTIVINHQHCVFSSQATHLLVDLDLSAKCRRHGTENFTGILIYTLLWPAAVTDCIDHNVFSQLEKFLHL